MALGIVNDDIFEQELEKMSAVIIQKPKVGRPEGKTEVADIVREIIGDTAVESGRKDALELAAFFDVSPSSASAYAKGATSTASYKNPNRSLGKHIQKTKERISSRAQGVITRALHNITDQKLESASASELIAVARGASTIVRDMEPASTSLPTSTPAVQFILHAPPMTREDKYEVIDIRSQEESDK